MTGPTEHSFLIKRSRSGTDVPVVRIEPSKGWVSLKLDELWSTGNSSTFSSGAT